jgi:amino acid permease
MVLGFIVAGFHYDTGPAVLALAGLLFGVLLYLFSFHLVATQAFRWLIELRGWPTFIAHLVFGVTASLLYWKLAKRLPDPQRGS